MKYVIDLIPNYGNDKIISKLAKSFPGVKTTGKTRPSGFIGCDVPVLLDIECSEETKKALDRAIRKVNTDTYGIR